LDEERIETVAAVRVKVEPEAGLPRREREELVETINLFTEMVSRIARGDLRVLHRDLASSNIIPVEPSERHPQSDEPHPATGRPRVSPEEQALIGFRSLLQFFEARRAALETDTITAPQVAELLGVSRQTPLNRAKEKSLLGMLDRGAWRFPLFQFDPAGPDGVLPGLPETLRALEPQQAFAKLVWLRRPNATLNGREPVELLRDGEVQPVIDAARAAAELP
jgi:hypothetical protein